MQKKDMRIDSYFSLPTDLAAEMASWSEFVSGHEYNVDLRSTDESVAVRLEQDDGRSFVRVRGQGEGPLFHRVLGKVAHALSVHSDDVWLTSWSD
jgi:hypothetical protein